jgi:hypothetical protein
MVTLMASTYGGGHDGPRAWLPSQYRLLGVDGYNRFPCIGSRAKHPWKPFWEIFAPARQLAATLRKGLFIGEVGCVEQDDCGFHLGNPLAKANWLRGMGTTLENWPEAARSSTRVRRHRHDGYPSDEVSGRQLVRVAHGLSGGRTPPPLQRLERLTGPVDRAEETEALPVPANEASVESDARVGEGVPVVSPAPLPAVENDLPVALVERSAGAIGPAIVLMELPPADGPETVPGSPMQVIGEEGAVPAGEEDPTRLGLHVRAVVGDGGPA